MTRTELHTRQQWSLAQKIDHSLGTLDQFISHTNGQCYIGFSGGKDSTVLLHLARIIKPDIKAVFCNTGNEYPDIVRFVRSTPNVEIIYPKLKPHEVIQQYGFPLISKESSETLHYLKVNPNSIKSRRALREIETSYRGLIARKYLHLKDVPYEISSSCCSILKKRPFLIYEREYKVSPILGIMASESSMRKTLYVKAGGCNILSGKRPVSNPLSIWNEQDVWGYIKNRKLPIADIYHKGAQRTGCMFCGYGCQFKNDNRLKLIYELYPKMYHRFMNYTNNGIPYRVGLREVLSINGLSLPDE